VNAGHPSDTRAARREVLQVATNEQLVSFYEQMLRIVLWEQRLLRLIDEGKVSGFYHAGRGHEAVAVGACGALRQSDYIMYDHRGCGQQIAKGLPLDKLYGDFLANMAGTTRGLGAGIVHIAWPDLGILGQSGTLGGCFPIAAGAALSAKYQGQDRVCVCFFGEGTGNRGTFHESANAASLWKLPVIWLCENNGWAVSVPVSESTAVSDLTRRAVGYGMPGVRVDGTDVLAVYDAVSTAVARARAGEGPTFIEATVQRFRGHFEGDPEPYRSKADVAEARKNDPVDRLAARLLAKRIVPQQRLDEIRARLEEEVDHAARQALAAPVPDRQRLFEGVYA
jgi:TPP-dependent pyruvate/acetoin dehydrogenase alpha subunit